MKKLFLLTFVLLPAYINAFIAKTSSYHDSGDIFAYRTCSDTQPCPTGYFCKDGKCAKLPQ